MMKMKRYSNHSQRLVLSLSRKMNLKKNLCILLKHLQITWKSLVCFFICVRSHSFSSLISSSSLIFHFKSLFILRFPFFPPFFANLLIFFLGKGGLTLDANTDFTNSVPTQAQQDEEDSIAAALKKRALQKRKTTDFLDKIVPDHMLTTSKKSSSYSEKADAIVASATADVEMEDGEAPQQDITEILADDIPLVNVGLAATLEFLRKRGGSDVKEQVAVRSRPTDVHIEIDNTDDVVIEYRDARGRILSTKQSFREQSYRFHGKAPGKKKIGMV